MGVDYKSNNDYEYAILNFRLSSLYIWLALDQLFIIIDFLCVKDMVAFSCCEYDGGAEEKHEMDIARERSWRGKFRRKHRIIKPGVNRVDGKCPLTPLEVCTYNFFFHPFLGFLSLSYLQIGSDLIFCFSFKRSLGYLQLGQ
jgi:hypothetical protein